MNYKIIAKYAAFITVVFFFMSSARIGRIYRGEPESNPFEDLIFSILLTSFIFYVVGRAYTAAVAVSTRLKLFIANRKKEAGPIK